MNFLQKFAFLAQIFSKIGVITINIFKRIKMKKFSLIVTSTASTRESSNGEVICHG